MAHTTQKSTTKTMTHSLDIPKTLLAQLNSAERGPWTYFNQHDEPTEGKRQQYIVEADEETATELLKSYLAPKTGETPLEVPNVDDIQTHGYVSMKHVYGGPMDTHVNILQTDGDNQRLRVEIND